MNLRYSTIIISSLILFSNLSTQETISQVWNNHKAAVALTYDDALNVHLDKVIPVLDSLHFKGTFYIPGNAAAFDSRLEDWRHIACNGHELGNHTLFHPCAGKPKGREWVSPDHDLDNYSVTQILDEIKLNNTLLKAIDGKNLRTFAYTCGDMSVGDSDFSKLIKDDFAGARGVSFQYEKINTIDLLNIKAFFVTNQTGEELINLAKQAIEEDALIVFLFHGVGGEHSINIPLSEHNKLVNFLKTNEKDFWVAPLVEISTFVSNNQ